MCYVGVKKKLEVLAKQKDCDTVRLWNASIINHMYWSTTTSGGNGESDEWKIATFGDTIICYVGECSNCSIFFTVSVLDRA
jgi:hypothetical protein